MSVALVGSGDSEKTSAPLAFASWDDEVVEPRVDPERRLAELAAAVGPLRRVLAAIVARLIESGAPARLCYARLGDYARERAGLSGRQLQDLARVHRALLGLPALDQALLANALPWSKVRLVARVATAEDERAWIARAQAVSTRRLEREVCEHTRACGQGESGDEADEPLTRVTVRCTPAVCERWALTREMAERVAGQRLRDGDALEWVVAEVLSALPVDPAFTGLLDEPPPAPGGVRRAPGWEPAAPARAPACPPPAEVAALAAGLEDADAFELDRCLRAAVRLEQTLDAAMAPWLRRVVCPEFEWRGDYQPLSSYAPEQLGMSASKARALIRLERACEVCPELRQAYRSGRLSWVKARCLLPLLLLDLPGAWRPAWVAWAARVTVRRLERDVERALLLRAGHGPAFRRCQFRPERAQDPIPEGERQLCARDVDPAATQELGFRVPCSVAALFWAARETLRKRLRVQGGPPVHDGEVFDALMGAAVRAWLQRDPRARRPDPVIERDGYRCAIPGCTSRRSLHDHHVIFRSRGGNDEEENRLTLCAFHHQRCVHGQLMRVTGDAPHDLVFEVGLRSGGPPLARYRSGDVAIAA